MKQKLAICRRNENGSLTIISERRLETAMNEQEMEVYAMLDGKQYIVEGDINLFYIVTGAQS